MNKAIKCIFYSAMTVIFLLTACAPAPAATQDPAVDQIQQTLDALSAAQNAPVTPDPKLDELSQKIDSLIAAQNSQSTADPQLIELKQQVEAIATQQKALGDTLSNSVAVSTSTNQPTPAAGAVTESTNSPSTCDASSSVATPSILRMDPEQGETYGGTPITITGTNLIFLCGNKWLNTKFLFGDVEANPEDVVCKNAETCTLKSPEYKEEMGTQPVLVKAANNDLESQEPNPKFTYLVPPEISKVSPNSGPIKGGTIVKVEGIDLTTDTTFLFGESQAAVLDCADNTCRVVSPGILSGTTDTVVWVQAINGSAASSIGKDEQAFKYLATPRYACDAMLIAPSSKGPYKPGAGFRIKWVVKNIGTVAWPAGQDLKYSGGTNMGEVSSMEIGKALQPNDTFTVTLDAKAPDKAGLYYMNWIVAGQGCSLYVAIQVE